LLAAQAILPLYFYTSKHLVSPEVEGFEANPLDRHPSRFLRWLDEWDSAAQSPSTTSPGAP
jgi:oligopeptide transport system substrate-binding protein